MVFFSVVRCRLWAEMCGFLHLLQKYDGLWLHKSRYRVCSLHFEERMYGGNKKKRLHADAVPTLKLPKRILRGLLYIAKVPEQKSKSSKN